MPTGLGKEDEEIWNQAKEIAKRENKENDYGYIVGVFKKIKKQETSSKNIEVQSNAINQEILSLAKQYVYEINPDTKKKLVKNLAVLLKELNKLGSLDFTIFINPEFSEFLTKGRKEAYSPKLQLDIPKKILIQEQAVFGKATEVNDFCFFNDSKLSLSQIYDVPNVKVVEQLKEDFVPIYDLCLVLRNEIINKQENKFEKINPMEATQKLSGLKELSQVELKDPEYIIEKLYVTPKIFIHKFNDSVQIFSEFGNEITKEFNNEIKRDLVLEPRDYIVECNITYMQGKKPALKESILDDFVINNRSANSKTQLIFNTTDCLYLGEDISKKKADERKTLLKTMLFGHHFKLAPFVITTDQDQIQKAICLMSKLQWSSGAKIIPTSQQYVEGQTNNIIEVIL